MKDAFTQFHSYLKRSWIRAGVPPSRREDCTQQVFMELLKEIGRDNFDAIFANVEQTSIPYVLNAETPFGPLFFRIIGRVMKRSYRERTYATCDDKHIGSEKTEIIDQAEELLCFCSWILTESQSAIILSTLEGWTVPEFATKTGLAVKTIHNRKSYAIKKLRELSQNREKKKAG